MRQLELAMFKMYAQGLLAGGGVLNIRDIEKGFRAAALKDGDAAFREFLSSIVPVTTECPECGAPLKKISDREKTIVSLMGVGEFCRAYYECPNDHGHFTPCDDVAGVNGTSFTPGVRLAVAKLASAGSFEWASGALAEIAGIYVSPKETQRVSESVGEAIEVRNKGRIESAMRPEGPRSETGACAEPTIKIDSTVYIEYDGTGIPMIRREVDGRSGKQPDGSAKTREAKLGCIFTQTGFTEEGDPIRDKNSSSYIGAIECAELFGWRIFSEASLRSIGSYKRVTILGDGAKWIWGIAGDHFPGAIQIVDLYHAKEHIYELARALFHQAGEQAAALDEWIKLLEAGEIETLAEKIRGVSGLSDELKEKATTEANYFTENAERMRYKKFKGMKLFVGSGVIEAGCKTVIGRRLKQSGMFWSLQGANAMIALRCADLSCNDDLASCFDVSEKPQRTSA